MKHYYFLNWLLILSILLPLVSTPAYANFETQEQANAPAAGYSISGKVIDSNGIPVSGVTIAAIPQPTSGDVKIVKVSSDHDLAGYYPIGLGDVNNKITVDVDWGGRLPGIVRYQFNSKKLIEDAISSTQSNHTFRFDQLLLPGTNTLTIIAIASDGSQSKPRLYTLTGWTAELGWLNQILGSLPYLGPDKIEFKVYVPGDPIDMLGLDVWLPGKPTKLGPQAVGKLTVPLNGGRYEAGLGVRYENEFDKYSKQLSLGPWRGKNALKLLGENTLKTDFTGQFEGNLTNTFPYLDRPDLFKFVGSGKVTFEISESVVVVIYPLAPAGPAIVNGLKAVPPVYDWIKDIAKFYVQLTPEVGGEMTFNWGVQDLEPVEATMYVQIDLEAGLKIDVAIAEGKVYIGGGSKLDFFFVPDAGIDKWVFYGKAGYEVKAGWFKASHEEKIEWTAYDRNALALDQMLSDLENGQLNWQLIPRDYSNSNYSAFKVEAAENNPFALQEDASSQGSESTALIENVYPYSEPSLAVRADGQAALVLNYDDPGRPLGQGYDLQYSLWDGNTWSTPGLVTNDTYPDAAAQTTWLPDGRLLVLWERLSDPALPITATLDITQTRKLDLAWAVYTPGIGTWSSPEWLVHSPGESDQTPILSNDGTSVWVAWRNNLQGKLSGDAQAPDSILTSLWNGAGWDMPVEAVPSNANLSDLSLAHQGSSGVLAWTAEVTPTGSITPTLQVFVSYSQDFSWSAPQQLTDDSLQNTHPRLIYRQGQPYLVWLAGQSLKLQQLGSSSIPLNNPTSPLRVASKTLQSDLQVDQFQLLQDPDNNLFAVFTGQQGSSQRDLYLAYYDFELNLWGLPQRLTDDRASESYPTAGLDSQQNLLMAFSETALFTDVLTTTLPGTTEVVSYTVQIDGPTDLMTLSHSLRTDLAVEALVISNEYPAPGEQVIVSARLANRGDRPLTDIPFVFQANNVELASQTIPGPLAAGEVITVTASYAPPSSGGLIDLVSIADPTNTIIEIDESNNQASLTAFGPDLALERIYTEQGGSLATVRAVVHNLGSADALASQLNIYHQTITGTLLLSEPLPVIAAGETLTQTMSVDLITLLPGQNDLVAVANPYQAAFAERVIDNNFYAFSLRSGADLAIEPELALSTPLDQSPVVLVANVQNVGNQDAPPSELAVYRGINLVDTPVFTTTVPGLSAGEIYTVTAQLTGHYNCGLSLVADNQQVAGEITRSNNFAELSGPWGTCVEKFIFLPMISRTAGNVQANSPMAMESGVTAQAATATFTSITGLDGTYSIANLPPGRYLVVPVQTTQTFVPSGRAVDLSSNITNVNFTSQSITVMPDGMVLITAGEFSMGCDPAHNRGLTCTADELPLHTVYLNAYYIDKYEVTNSKYAQCVAAGSCTTPAANFSLTHTSYYGNPTYADYPVVYVSWDQANDYCAWSGKHLPTEAEWEKAARGTTARTFPWGDQNADCTLANYNDRSNGPCVGDTSQVGDYPVGASRYGVLDMAGNVWEWVNDWFGSDYYQTSPYDNPTGPTTATYKAQRGGSFSFEDIYLRTANRNGAFPWSESNHIGFRCAKTASGQRPPLTPTDPYPIDGATNQPVNLQMGWTANEPDGNVLAYDIYLEVNDSTPDVLVANNLIVPSFVPDNILAYSQYYWQVAVRDEHGVTTTGPVWGFSTSSTILTDMVIVPAGEFQMGCDPAHSGGFSCFSNELPLHTVYLDAYYIDKTEVTNDKYAQCVAESSCTPPENSGYYYGNPTYADHPVVWVSWDQATDYCTWEGNRLPTEAEWEKAARGITVRAYPWGDNSPTCTLANFYDHFGTGGDCVGGTSAVGSYPAGASPYGALDMAGNVIEWVNDWYSDAYYSTYPAGGWPSNPQGPATGTYRVQRNGSWDDDGFYLRSASRFGNPPTYRGLYGGFRCAKTAAGLELSQPLTDPNHYYLLIAPPVSSR